MVQRELQNIEANIVEDLKFFFETGSDPLAAATGQSEQDPRL